MKKYKRSILLLCIVSVSTHVFLLRGGGGRSFFPWRRLEVGEPKLINKKVGEGFTKKTSAEKLSEQRSANLFINYHEGISKFSNDIKQLARSKSPEIHNSEHLIDHLITVKGKQYNALIEEFSKPPKSPVEEEAFAEKQKQLRKTNAEILELKNLKRANQALRYSAHPTIDKEFQALERDVLKKYNEELRQKSLIQPKPEIKTSIQPPSTQEPPALATERVGAIRPPPTVETKQLLSKFTQPSISPAAQVAAQISSHAAQKIAAHYQAFPPLHTSEAPGPKVPQSQIQSKPTPIEELD